MANNMPQVFKHTNKVLWKKKLFFFVRKAMQVTKVFLYIISNTQPLLQSPSPNGHLFHDLINILA